MKARCRCASRARPTNSPTRSAPNFPSPNFRSEKPNVISNSSRIIGAVEIGTGKVVVLVGEIARGRSLNIIGVGVAPARGVMKGEVVDYKAACEATHHALEMAEKRAGAKLEEVWLAQSGGHLDAFYNEASVNVKSADNTVTALDIDSVSVLAKQKELPAGRTRIHEIRRP